MGVRTITVFVLISIGLVVFLYVGVPWIYGRRAQILLKRKIKKLNCLILTFDDGLSFHNGPGGKLTSGILDILAEYDVKATFFLLGRHIPGREAIVQRISVEGHEIGSHGYSHLNYWKVSPFRALVDMKCGSRAIDVVLGAGRGTYPFRPPYGKLNLISLLYLWIHRVPIVYWTFDLGDTWPVHKRDSRRIATLMKESEGAVVLAHDFDRIDEDINKMVLESVRSVLAQAKEKKIPVLTVSQFLRSHSL